MKLHVFGAAGAGVTTLGAALAASWGVPYFDTDAYFWEATEPPFARRREPGGRNAALAADLAGTPGGWVLGGSLLGWGDEWRTRFDAAIFLWLPPALRLARLRTRELARYGEAIGADPARRAQFEAFMAWAAGYDDGSSGGHRTLANHENWLAALPCPVLKLRRDQSVAARLAAVQAWLASLGA